MANSPRINLTQTQRLALNPSLQGAIGILRTDAAGLTRYLEEQAAANPHLRLDRVLAPPGDWLPRWRGVFEPLGGRGGAQPDLAPAASPSLIAHVLQAIATLNLPARARRIAEALAEALEPSGWLARPPAAIAAGLQMSEAEVSAVLDRLQAIEPAGLFARDLADCLRLQAREAGVLDPIMSAVLANLPLLASGDFARLARACGATEAEVLARFRLIRGMDPKPGASFDAGFGNGALPPPPREPDLLARPLGTAGWEIALNRSALPTVKVQRSEVADRAALAIARGLKQAVEARNATLLRVGREIAARQQVALSQGPAALEPMTMAEVGAALDLHESTISRVVAGAAIDTPRGTIWLRQMFSGARSGAIEGQSLSAAALRHRLAALIAAEDPARPLSDARLVKALAVETGITLPRRTLAHYREMAGIPAGPRRKRRPG
ncbi:MAG: RNA polymerase sigma-54 factor [Rhodobacteraceae bacterium]|nr:RNA polymerase sigma-54 factor [Paracoccaceae bacterium]